MYQCNTFYFLSAVGHQAWLGNIKIHWKRRLGRGLITIMLPHHCSQHSDRIEWHFHTLWYCEGSQLWLRIFYIFNIREYLSVGWSFPVVCCESWNPLDWFLLIVLVSLNTLNTHNLTQHAVANINLMVELLVNTSIYHFNNHTHNTSLESCGGWVGLGRRAGYIQTQTIL